MFGYLYILLVALTFTHILGQSDLTRTPGAKGSRVVESVLQILKRSCLYSDDSDFLRRLAHVQSTDGLDFMTFRQGYDGGIWQVDQDQFTRTLQESAKLKGEYDDLLSKLGIDWKQAKWSDLLKPLYSGIAAALYLKLQQISSVVPNDVTGQANFWQNNFRPTKLAQEFQDDVNEFEKNCDQPPKLDLVYLVDTSKGMADSQLAEVKGHIKDQIARIAAGHGLGTSGDRVALITYSTRAILAFPLERSIDPQSLMASVDLAPRAGGSTNTSDAFHMAKMQVLPTARDDAIKVVVLVIDGKSDDARRALAEAIPLKSNGVEIVTIGIGNAVDTQELESLASLPVCENSRRLRSYSDLSSLRLKFGQRVCTEPLQLEAGEYSFPCSHNVLARLPTDGKAYNLKIRVTNGEADILASYGTSNPSQQNNDFSHRLVTSQPVILKVNDTRSLSVKVTTDKPGQGQTGLRSCTGDVIISIDPDVKRKQECNNHFLDLLLLVDSTVLKDVQESKRLVNFASQFVSQFDVGQDKHRMGVATFDQSTHNILWLKDSDSLPQFLTAVKQLSTSVTSSGQAGQGSDLATALKWTREVGLAGQNGARTTSARTVLVVTSGTPQNSIAAQTQGRLLQSEGIRTVVVALGQNVDNVTLSSIASSPLRLITASDVSTLMSSMAALTNATCGSVKLTCVEQGVVRECSPEDLINSQYAPIVVGDRNLTTNPCALPPALGLPAISRFPHPSRKDRFLICDSKRQAYVVLCPLGELYNANVKECETAPPTSAPPTSTTPTSTTPMSTTSSTTTTTGSTTPPKKTTTATQSTRPTMPTSQAPPPSTTAYTRGVCSYENIARGERLHELPGSVNKYVSCSLVAGQGMILTCPQGQWWIQGLLTCLFVCPVLDAAKGQVDCSILNPCSSGLVYYKHQRDSTKFIQCNSRGEAFIFSCPTSQVWKSQLQACDIQ